MSREPLALALFLIGAQRLIGAFHALQRFRGPSWCGKRTVIVAAL
jgi:hypothetical protein